MAGNNHRELEGLYPTVYPRLISTARQWNMSDPEAFAQDVFAKALASSFADDGRATMVTWVWKIAHNLKIDEHRKRRPELLPEDAHQQSSRSAEAKYLSDERHRTVRRALKKLTELQYLVVADRFFRGLSIAETAWRLGTTAGAVKAAQFRAVAVLGELEAVQWLRQGERF